MEYRRMLNKTAVATTICFTASVVVATQSLAITYTGTNLKFSHGPAVVASISNGTPVGAGLYGSFLAASESHAVWWNPASNTYVDLHPAAYQGSQATDINGTGIVGDAFTTVTNQFGSTSDVTHAMYWQSTTSSAVDLNPAGFDYSEAHGVWGQTQVGFAQGNGIDFDEHPMLWHGTAASAIDLAPSGYG